MAEFPPIDIDRDITRAHTLPSWCYRDAQLHEQLVEQVFANSWQFVGGQEVLPERRYAHPFTLLEGCLDEPMVLTRDGDGREHCLSNVCTHRGNLVATESCGSAALRCGYHGRKFGLDGAFKSMPEFLDARGFPSAEDSLRRLPHARWQQFWFAALEQPDALLGDLLDALEPLQARTGFLPWERARFDASRAREFSFDANWMLYLDNYLEGFHIPFVHKSLAAELDSAGYRTENFEAPGSLGSPGKPLGSVQIAAPRTDEHAFDLPAGHPDGSGRVGAWYFWCWPNLMWNVYPWGCSVNIVVPLAVDRTRVLFRPFVWDPDKLDSGAGNELDRVEFEDEAIVQSVQRGMRSRHYQRGRYSPTQERCVHHFHRMVAAVVAELGAR